jgi:hypothetical protein
MSHWLRLAGKERVEFQRIAGEYCAAFLVDVVKRLRM